MDIRGMPDDFVDTVMFNDRMTDICTAIPGRIESFNYTTGMAVVQPTVRMKSVENGVVKYFDPPLITNVPVVLPQSMGGGLFITVPVNKDDPCLLVFGQRSIDNVVELGGIQNPYDTDNPLFTRLRHHDMTDAMCIVGLGVKPAVPSNWQSDAIEVRNEDRSVCFSLKDDKIYVKGDIAVTGSITTTGEVTAHYGGAKPIALTTHIHSGVMGGFGNTSAPTA